MLYVMSLLSKSLSQVLSLLVSGGEMKAGKGDITCPYHTISPQHNHDLNLGLSVPMPQILTTQNCPLKNSIK